MKKINSLIKEWINKAESDLKFAELSFDGFDEFYSQMCILCHDAVEKYLKAYLYANKVNPPKIHDLVTLINHCIEISKNDKRLKSIEKYCKELNSYYIPLKYPSHYPPVDKKMAKRAIDSAKIVENVIKKALL
ncbi:MAG: HEPN domain-containing protein [Elusimicrobia bacterium]|nr:HEPN domain-containing protein [Candidatus Liberimonas magnetica]